METKTIDCPKCEGQMQKGFLVDRTHKNPVAEHCIQQEWVEGDPDQKSSVMGGLKISTKTCLKTISYRCVKCGYLESYAN
ncbi:MAG: hypothetical protein COA79_17550 [Planctomycetota bacterium]|nr:MAG: hypothetical protein COA79_17550 [Planctomycetota bacterium]